MAPRGAMSEAPNLDGADTVGIQSALASVQDLVKGLAADLEDCRSEHSELRARLGALEGAASTQQARSGSDGLRKPSQPSASVDSLALSEEISFSLTNTKATLGVAGAATQEAAGAGARSQDVRQLAERLQQLEGSLERLRELQADRLRAQDGPIAMRLQAMELELAACVRPGDLQGQRQELQEMRTRLAETQLPEAVRALGQELRGELQARAEGLREDLEAVSSSVTSKLRQLDEQLHSMEDQELRAALIGGRSTGSCHDQEDEDSAPAGGALLRCQRLAEEARRAALMATERVGRLGEELLGRLPEADEEEEEEEEEKEVDTTCQPSTPLRTVTPTTLGGSDAAPRMPELGETASRRPVSVGLQQRVARLERRLALQETCHVESGHRGSSSRPTRPCSAPAPDASTWAAVDSLGRELRELWGGRLEALEAQVRAVESRMSRAGSKDCSLLQPAADLDASVALSGIAAAGSPERRGAGGRLGAAEAEVRELRCEVEELREALDELRKRGGGGSGDPPGRTDMGEAVAALARSAELLEQQLDEDGAEPAPPPAVLRLEGRVEALSEELEAMRRRRADSASEGQAAVEARMSELEEGLSALLARSAPLEEELDRRSEARLTSVWQELTKHAEAAATRADQLEQGFQSRLEKLEASCAQLRRSSPSSNASKVAPTPGADLSKELEALQWRISWLEWATKGEKRSFGRPLDAKAVLPAPLPGAASAPGFGHQPTEDVELWAREQGGRMRPRRRISGPGTASSDAAASPEQLGPLRPSRSHGRLPARVL